MYLVPDPSDDLARINQVPCTGQNLPPLSLRTIRKLLLSRFTRKKGVTRQKIDGMVVCKNSVQLLK